MLSIYPLLRPLSTGHFVAFSLIANLRRAARFVLFPSCFEPGDLYARSAGDFGYVASCSPDVEG